MKKLSLIVAAIGLAFGASAASAEPNRDTANYYFVSMTDTAMTLIPDSVQTNGTRRTIWLFNFLRSRASDGRNTADAVWSLTELDCSSNRFRFVRTEGEGPNGRFVMQSAPGAFEVINPGTAASATYKLVCRGDASDVELISAENVVNAMLLYRAM
jgi:hypothetical protein